MATDLQAVAIFRERFDRAPDVVVTSPGRINLIGEHTDYNDGFMLPMAVDRQTVIAAASRADRTVTVHSLGFGDARFDLDDLHPTAGGWVEYLKGVAWAMGPETLVGWEGVITTDIPLGAGLSSSAALEVGAALTFVSLARREWDPVSAALACQRAENEWLELNSGIMDQLVGAVGRAGHAVLIDSRSLQTTTIPMPEGADVVVLDTGVRRKLMESRYNDRRRECEEVARAFGVATLRDLTLEQLNDPPCTTPRLLGRARHVVTENERTLAAAEALTSGDIAEVGRLMTASHQSLRVDYEVSSRELDAMVDAAHAAPGCYGARLTGGGFAGCAIALVERDAVAAFRVRTARAYEQATGRAASIYVCRAVDSARVLHSRSGSDAEKRKEEDSAK